MIDADGVDAFGPAYDDQISSKVAAYCALVGYVYPRLPELLR